MKLFASSVVVSDDESAMLQISAARTELELRAAQQLFRGLYQKWKGPIMSYLYHWTQDSKLAEDLLQETFLKVFRARESYQVSAKFSTWLWTIARNTAIDHGKKRREQWVELSSVHAETLSSEESLADDTLVEQEWIHEREKWVKSCLEKLTPRAREMISLRVLSEESYEDISKISGESLGAVKTILFRAKKVLTECIEHHLKGASR